VSLRGKGAGKVVRDQDDPFRVLLIADFSGRAARLAQGAKLELRKPRKVDAGNLDAAFAAFGAEIEVPGLRGAERLRLGSVEDLHPDQVLSKVNGFRDALATLRGLREGSSQPELLEQARRWVGAAAAQPELAAPGASTAASGDASGGDSATLDRLLGRAPQASSPEPQRAPAVESVVASFLKEAVRPHLAVPAGGERDLLTRELSRLLQDGLRSLLHSPAFRELEAAWRGAERVIRTLDTDESLEIHVLDACYADLVGALEAAGGDLERSALHALFSERAWSVVALNGQFGANDAELTVLASLTAIVARNGGALLTDAAPGLFGVTDVRSASDPKAWAPADSSALWHALRTSPLAAHVGLVFPPVLARLPYGKKTDEVESLAFEELSSAQFVASERLWGSAAFALLTVFGLGFREYGWGYSHVMTPELGDLPSHTFEQDGERQLVPATEVNVSERVAPAFLDFGVMPLIARRDRSAVRLGGLRSISEPAAGLSGIDTTHED